ncbi:MAG: polysaccharide biosynthesis tyrosine autokinase [Thermodesulfobacteriota bacterium]|nr:polysaccharide biosynthesis tyrosine autokinase [Thermodesulfobacteriota bacterium]
MAQYDVDLRDYWRVLKKRKAILVVVVLFMGLFSYFFAMVRGPAPEYQATASVKIEKVSNMANLLTGMFTWGLGANVTTQTHIITSFPVLIQTAKDLGWLPKDLTSEAIRGSKQHLSAVDKLRAMLETEAESGTSIINIMATSNDPDEAAKVANTVAEAYRGFNILERNRQTMEMRGFIEKQLGSTLSRLEKAEEDLRSFKQEEEVISLDARATQILEQLSAVESDYSKVRKEIDELSFQLRSVEGEKVTPKRLAEAAFLADPDSPIRRLSPTLSNLTLKRTTLLVDFTEDHPQVKEIDGQIEGLLNELRVQLQSYLKALEPREKELATTIESLREQSRNVPDNALRLARLEREVSLYETLAAELKRKHQEVLIQESGRIEEVTVVRPAMVPTGPVNIGSSMTTVATGIIIGIVLGIVLAFVTETLDTSIGTIEDVESLLQIPVLGLIPSAEIQGKGKRKGEPGKGTTKEQVGLVTHFEPKSIVAESYRSLRTNLQFMDVEREGKAFLITSSSLQEGKTFNVVNLALSMAQAGDKVLLIEGDLRRPKISTMFGLDRAPGITDYVLGNYQWQEVVNTITDVMLGEFEMEDILRTPGLDNLSIMTAGTRPPNPSEILSSSRFDQFVQEAKEKYDAVLLDAPPVLPVADAAEIARRVDGVILVYEVGRIARGVLKRAKLTLDNVNARVLGVILSNVKPEVSPDIADYHHRYYYGYKEEGEKGKTRKSPGMDISSLGRALFQKKVFPLVVLVIALAFLGVAVLWIGFN